MRDQDMRNISITIFTVTLGVWLISTNVFGAENSTWPQHRGNSGSTGVSADESVKPPLKLAWSYRCDSDTTGDAGAGLTVAGGKVFCNMAMTRSVLALDALTGAFAWECFHHDVHYMQTSSYADGKLFVHIFCHRRYGYAFEATGATAWLGRNFFTGGIMPSAPLMEQCATSFEIEDQWRWSGEHYARTADLWLANFDARQEQIMPVLEDVYGKNAGLWHRRWRLFFLATSGLFGYRSGTPWGISHYRLRPL